MLAATSAQAVIIDGVNIAGGDLYFEAKEAAPGAFVTALNFNLTGSVILNITANSVTGVQFSNLWLDGAPIGASVINAGIFSSVFKTSILVSVPPAAHVFTFFGTSTGVATSGFNGNISITAVPETATWAMMIAGIAAVGTALRRRSVARVSFS
jgi:hypothetical protein